MICSISCAEWFIRVVAWTGDVLSGACSSWLLVYWGQLLCLIIDFVDLWAGSRVVSIQILDTCRLYTDSFP